MFQRIFPLLFLLLLAACDDEQPSDFTLGQTGQTPPPSGKPTPTPSSDAARLEMPRLRGDAHELFIVHRTAPAAQEADSIVNFAYAYDTEQLHSRWVAFRFDNDTRPKRVKRKDYRLRPKYPTDPKLPARYALAADLSFDGRDHGHLCASADRLYSREANDQTFYMSNMSPQEGHFNQGYWTLFEEHVQTLGRDLSFADTLYVVKGGTITPDKGVLSYLTAAPVPVPKYYYMALLKVKNGVFSAMGFWVEHKRYDEKRNKRAMQSHVVSIATLQERTGIDFFHNLNDNIEQHIEHATPTLSAWRL